MNNLDYEKLLHKDTALPYLSTDSIFLFAGIYTLLLLIFYLPIKITSAQIESAYLENTQAANSAAASPEGNIQFVKTVLSKFQDLLVPTSPLIAGFIQLLLNYIFK